MLQQKNDEMNLSDNGSSDSMDFKKELDALKQNGGQSRIEESKGEMINLQIDVPKKSEKQKLVVPMQKQPFMLSIPLVNGQ